MLNNQNAYIRLISLLSLLILYPFLASCLPSATNLRAKAITKLIPTATQSIASDEQTSISINQPLPTPSITPQGSATPEIISIVPDNFQIHGFKGHKQYFALGCEASAAVDLAAFYGVEINEFEFQHRLPISDNPDKGFVGSVNSPWGQVPPYGYGVHAGPVAWLLREYGLPAVGYKGFSLEQLKRQISNGAPIITWVIGNMVGGVPYEYVDKDGVASIVAAYEHVVIITGYDTENVVYINNGLIYTIPYEIFLRSWGVLENMVVYIE